MCLLCLFSFLRCIFGLGGALVSVTITITITITITVTITVTVTINTTITITTKIGFCSCASCYSPLYYLSLWLVILFVCCVLYINIHYIFYSFLSCMCIIFGGAGHLYHFCVSFLFYILLFYLLIILTISTYYCSTVCVSFLAGRGTCPASRRSSRGCHGS